MADIISHRKSPLYHQFSVSWGLRIRYYHTKDLALIYVYAIVSVTYIILFVACVISSCVCVFLIVS